MKSKTADGSKGSIDSKNIEGSTGVVGEVKSAAKVGKAAGTGSNDEVLNITLGKSGKKKR